MRKHLFCFGFGYTASRLARLLQSRDTLLSVSGTTRSLAKHRSETDRPTSLYLFSSIDQSWVQSHGKDVTHVLHSIPPGETGDPVLTLFDHWRRDFPNLQWFGYLSTTGVYGNHEGNWVDESSSCYPTNARSQARVDAEKSWIDLAFSTSFPLHIFRLSGIYGPGRSVLDAVRAGTARRVDQPDRLFSRIHVDDICQVLSSSIALPHPGEVYNLADDLPATQAEVVSFACALLNKPLPPLIGLDDPSLSEMARSFYAGNRKVKNDKIKQHLGISLLYPNYKLGLEGIYHLEIGSSLP